MDIYDVKCKRSDLSNVISDEACYHAG